jgi:hypothetical protein
VVVHPGGRAGELAVSVRRTGNGSLPRHVKQNHTTRRVSVKIVLIIIAVIAALAGLAFVADKVLAEK